MRTIIRMNLPQQFAGADIIPRSESEDWRRVLTVTHLVGGQVPFECHHASGAKRLLEPGLPVKKCDALKPSLAEQCGQNQRCKRDRQDARLSGLDTVVKRQMGIAENPD